MKSVLVLAESDDCSRVESLPLRGFDAVVLAFWASPEFVARVEKHGAKVCWRLNDFVPSYLPLIQRAYRLAHAVAESAPRYREVNALRAWENVIANALLVPLGMTELGKGLRERLGAETEVVFLTRNDTQRAFEALRGNGANEFVIRVLEERETHKQHDAGGRFVTWLKLVSEARRDGDWANVVAVPVETLDAQYRLRTRLRTRVRTRLRGADKTRHNEVLFYSSYVNYARALAKHAAARNIAPQWVVNNHSARKGLPRGAAAANLWEFGEPRVAAHQAILRETAETIAHAPEEAEGLPLRAALAASGEVRETLTRVLPLLLAEIDLMHACLEEIQPQEVWVANQWGGEGCVLQVAHAHGIQVTQVQHGFLETFYACAPIYTERFLVWDEFWRGVVSSEGRGQVEVFNANPMIAPQKKQALAARTLTFFSTPPQVVLWWNPSVVAWETVRILDDLMAQGNKVIVRAHPMDELERYTQVWMAKDGKLPGALELNKGTPLEQVLERTGKAVMVFSTVLMDCEAHGIPVYGIGWYPTLYRAQIEAMGAIEYKDSIESLTGSVL